MRVTNALNLHLPALKQTKTIKMMVQLDVSLRA